MTLEEIRSALERFNLKRVAADTGIPHVTIWRFKAGKTQRPSWQLVDTLEKYVREIGGNA